MPDKKIFKVGTRSSPLALAQTQIVIDELLKKNPEFNFELVTFQTIGDKNLDRPLSEIGGKGLFTQELESALLDNSIDFAVHSFKDMPTAMDERLTFGATFGRSYPGDVFLSKDYESLSSMPKGTRIGTSSLRRKACLNFYYPHLDVVPLRGNVGTRISKMNEGACDGMILAHEGLKRLNQEHLVREILSIQEFVPAPAQGSLAVQCRKSNPEVENVLKTINSETLEFVTSSERLFLEALEGNCKTPLAAYVDVINQDTYDFRCMVVTKEGKLLQRHMGCLTAENMRETVLRLAHEFKPLI